MSLQITMLELIHFARARAAATSVRGSTLTVKECPLHIFSDCKSSPLAVQLRLDILVVMSGNCGVWMRVQLVLMFSGLVTFLLFASR
jgi:hypothetical protein